MNYQVQIFEVESASQTAKAKPEASFAVTADTVDEARRLSAERLASGGRSVRAVSFLKEGGLAAVTEPMQPPPPQALRAQRLLRQRGVR